MSAIYKKYRREWSTLVALLITFVLFSALEPSYLSATNVHKHKHKHKHAAIAILLLT